MVHVSEGQATRVYLWLFVLHNKTRGSCINYVIYDVQVTCQSDHRQRRGLKSYNVPNTG